VISFGDLGVNIFAEVKEKSWSPIATTFFGLGSLIFALSVRGMGWCRSRK
jgi:hypothetical protein